ncbi:phosphoribosyltransferase [Cryobacterium sp. TMT2-10]|uniref:Phosphoribosyltransferase n=1 Tax=Cryobacterium shii TaxID=1259235 RepID=A0AAQ2C3Y7_9MICO|nr:MULTISPECIES: phosphoribosyltransferase [Cryobacterium]TFC42485.1 phosphoribosyltransferase [Cryobacterium shii]TFC80817.1 phosphoribosyltransferase [Cryobacterium sp. TmT2-59]TFD18676.1 phosphoribosyltransferase [Cryobacterium sp. TMT4-10]TFD28478.1 phosphoribosyltransferase [Cryobacterium sp. TMT2-23]TFD35448.1 phosphoribosyltransferase [Cryobacterium sp. TMT2-10]
MAFDADDAAADLADTQREVLDWGVFADASRQLATDVLASGFQPDVVIAIARGGLLLAGAMSYALGTKNCGSINVQFYTGVDERLPVPVLSGPMLDAPSLTGLRVLLVDDVSDSGNTLAMVVALLREAACEVRTATLFTKPRTVLVPDFTWCETDRWIVFPWSSLPAVTVPVDTTAPAVAVTAAAAAEKVVA